MFLLNNTFIQALHVLTISRYLNTMSNHAVCTVGFAAIGAIASWVCSMPRTFDALSKLATLSAFFTFVSVILAAAFAGAEGKHGTAGYQPESTVDPVTGKTLPGGEPLILIIPAAGTTFVSGMNAFLNIAYTFIGQITLPSFIAEMKNPYDFRKALWVVTICEIIVFCLVGGIGKSIWRVSILHLTLNSLRLYWHPIQHCAGVRIPWQRHLQEGCVLIHDPDLGLPWSVVRLGLGQIPVLPNLSKQPTHDQPYRGRLGDMGWHSGMHLDLGFHCC